MTKLIYNSLRKENLTASVTVLTCCKTVLCTGCVVARVNYLIMSKCIGVIGKVPLTAMTSISSIAYLSTSGLFYYRGIRMTCGVCVVILIALTAYTLVNGITIINACRCNYLFNSML